MNFLNYVTLSSNINLTISSSEISIILLNLENSFFLNIKFSTNLKFSIFLKFHLKIYKFYKSFNFHMS